MNTHSAIALEKAQIRKEIQALVRAIPVEWRAGLSAAAAQRLTEQEPWREAHTILAYLPLGDELDLRSALTTAMSGGKTVALPRYNRALGAYDAAAVNCLTTGVAKGAFGVAEPLKDAPAASLNRLDLVLVPGVAFDRSGKRLGRGKGFYDRLLAHVKGIKCGVALDEQVVENLPAEPHDIAMNVILTPTRWLVVPSAQTRDGNAFP